MMQQTATRIDALAELKDRSQWVVYCLEPDEKDATRLTKVPYNAKTGYKASTTAPKDWATYDKAVQAYNNGKNVKGQPYSGVGYVFNDDYTGIDFDYCVDEHGNIEQWAQDEIDRINSYAELSPSSTGVHVIARAVLPERWDEKKKKFARSGTKRKAPNQAHGKAAIEIYCEGRFFTVTGNHLQGTPHTIENRQAQIIEFHTRITAPKPAKESTSTPRDTSASLSLSDNDLIDMAHRAKNRTKFAALWRGDISGYLSQSEADQAFCNLLAFWTGKDKARMQRLFERSGLHREKWDNHPTYASDTLDKAIAQCREVYTPGTTKERVSRVSSNGHHSNNGNHPPVATKESDSSLPQIYLSGQLREKWNVALNALREAEKKNPTIFIQSARLVQIGQDDKKHPIIMQLGIAELKNALSRSADYYRLKEKGDEIIPVEISPPKEIAEAILALNPGEWKFPSLEAIVETPVIRPDGSILDAPGYDEATRLYYYPQEGMKDCKIPDHPTKKDIAAALAIVDEAIGEFPYVDQADRANAYACLLTPFIRPGVRHVPLGLIDAPKQGTGKGLLSDTISVTSTGASAAILTLSDSDEELQKNITSLLIEGVTIITIDNISGKLQSKHLDGVLTADTWRGRILGQSKMVKVPQRATWIATGNNIRLGGDLARRCYRIRLDPHVSRPWMRKGFKHEDLLAWVTEHRSELIAALLTLARAWFVAGKPQYSDIPMLGTFTSWAKTVGGILQHCGVQGFLANLEQLYDEADEDSAQWEAFLIAWRKAFGENWKTTSEIVKELTPLADSAESVADSVLVLALPDALQEALKEKPKSFSIVLGKALEKRLEACFGDDNLRIERDVDKKTKAKKWRVVGKVADSADSSTRHTQDENEFIQTDEKNDIEYDATNYPHYPQAESVHTPQSSTTSQSTAQSVNADSSYTLSAQKKDFMPPWLIPGTSEWKKQVMRNGLDEMMRRRTAALLERAAQS